ncbi:MAG: hypothetical protein R3324_17805, partial [Halobacteriales archaeon]|nr:hypothetical protein [Halobacteriales archaeon]
MDLSSRSSDHLPKSQTVVGGLLRSVGLLSFALAVATVAGWLIWLALAQVFPGIPAYVGLIGGVVVLIPVLRAIAARFSWIMPWYYLLPAIVFLLTFTFFPVALTVYLAFTDYSGVRNGQLNTTTQTEILDVEGTRITIANPRVFDCEDLRDGCADVRARVYASGTTFVAAESVEGDALTLSEAVPEGRTVNEVELTFPDAGIDVTFAVTSAEDRTVILSRPAPEALGAPDLTEVTLRLDRNAYDVMMTGDEGDVITLASPLPEGIEPVAIERYNDFGFVGFRNFRTI